MKQVYTEIISTRFDKLKVISLLETEGAPRVRDRAYERMQEHNKKLTELHKNYLESIRKIKMESTGEKLWCIETKLELESMLDDIYLLAYGISEYDKPISQ